MHKNNYTRNGQFDNRCALKWMSPFGGKQKCLHVILEDYVTDTRIINHFISFNITEWASVFL